jgi:N-acetylneuraminic acid mutarotase
MTAAFKLPAAVTDATAVADDGKLLTLGGRDANGATTNAVTSIDPSAGSATSAGTLRTSVADAASAVVGGTPTVFGGNTKGKEDVTGVTDTVQTYSGGTSQDVGKLPAPRENLGATTANGKTYVAGGDDGSSAQGDIWATSDGKSFQTVGKLDTPVRDAAVATTGTGSDQKVTVFGGQDTNGPTDAIQQFDPATGKTRTVGRLPVELTDASAFTIDGTTYLAGGRSGGQLQTKIYKFDPSADTVTEAGALPAGITNAAAAGTASSAYVAGGEAEDGKATDAITEVKPQ